MKVKNWSKFQHFKDRRPPWIKLYRDLLDDREWHKLDGDSAKLLVSLWLIGSEGSGNLPPVDELAFRLRLDEKHIEKCLKHLDHWLISDLYQDDISASQKISVADIEVPLRDREEIEKEEEEEKKIQPDKPAKFSASDFLLEQGVRESVCKDWLSLRKQKRAPATLTAIKGIQAEAQKAGITLDAALTHCCERGWQGFKAEWITKPSPNPVTYMTAAQQSRETIAALTGGLKNGTEERDITGESIRIA